MNDLGVSLLKNSNEQTFAEKLRALLKCEPSSRRYKDIYDMFYLKDHVVYDKLYSVINLLVIENTGMIENNFTDV